MIDRSFQLLRTNPRLTTNIKMVVSSDDKIYLESFNTNKQLSDQKYKHYQLDRQSTYEYSLTKFFDGLPAQLAFDVKYDNDTQLVYSSYDKQFDDIYWGGAKSIEDKWYKESFEYFAPLYIKKNKLPDGFVILRVDEPIPYEERDNQYVASDLNRDNFFTQIVDKWKCVSLIDLRYQTNIGYYMINNIVDNDRFPATPFEMDFRKYEFSKWYGIDYNAGVYAIKSKYLKNILDLEQPHLIFEKTITNGYRDNSLVFPNIWNIKYLFDDRPATPDKFRDYSINRYYGFYVDDLEFVTNLTSYITPTVKAGVTLSNNIFIQDGIEMSLTPFEEEFDVTQEYFIYWNDKFHQVVKIQHDGRYVYKIIADEDLSGIDFTKTNDRVCFISYQSGNYRCMNYDNPSGYTNYIYGYTDDFIIDPYEVATSFSDPPSYNTMDMYGDLYLIKIDEIYHVLKKRDDNYFVQTDYAINSYPAGLQYWKGGKDNIISKKINTSGNSPLVYSVYRLKFNEIKDFDFDRIDTKFADFDFEKSTYYSTSEQKLYAVEYNDLSIEKQFKIHPRGEDGQYQVMNISSEYIADDELYEIKNNDLTEVWRKNSYINKWGFLGSNSHADYPYKMNNSLSVGDVYNRTSDVFSYTPNETSKNIDYFYRIGNTVSGDTKIRYSNQSIFIETDLMDQTFSEKFNLDMYMKSDVDYFDYFFKNKIYFESNGQIYQKPTLKYSVFDGGDKYSRSSTIFKGLKFNVLGLSDITRDEENKIDKYIITKDTYNGYKFAIILNDVYKYYGQSKPLTSTGKLTNGLQDNNIIDENANAIHIFLNDKYKNILCVINFNIPLFATGSYANYSGKTFNDVSLFGEKFGLYYGSSIVDDRSIIVRSASLPETQYEASTLTATNFISALNNLNDTYNFNSGVTYYYINSDGFSGSTGNMNLYNSGNTMLDVDNWFENFPPYILTVDYPDEIDTKTKSYNKSALKGPETNIYDKYNTYYTESTTQNLQISEPLARQMDVNLQQDTYNTIRYGETITYKNSVYRYNGKYEPVFKTIPLFKPSYIYNSINSGYTEQQYNYFESNYKFDYDYGRFGLIDELIFSKVNPKVNPLKLKNSNFDKSIYPMIDEFGYQFSSRFIFSSSWDRDFYVITNPDQIKMTKKIKLTSLTTTVTNTTTAGSSA